MKSNQSGTASLKKQIEKESLTKIREDMHSLVMYFKQMLHDLNEPEVAETLSLLESSLEEQIGIKTDLNDEKLIQVLSIVFQLMNLVEENSGVQSRRKIENQLGSNSIRGSWAETFEHWLNKGVDEDQIAQLLPTLKIMPVLTAHPTEAKRISILELHRELYLLLVKKENHIWSGMEKHVIDNNIKALLERWWRSGEVYLEKPSLTSERNNVMHFFSKVFPESLKVSDKRLKYTWNLFGFDPMKLSAPEHYPVIEFGSWVGGDRDGHPYVSAEVTSTTLLEHRREALALVKKELLGLAREFSFSETKVEVPADLCKAIEANRILFGSDGEAAVMRNPLEPWRQFINLMLLKLGNTIAEEFESETKCYRTAADLQADLRILRNSLLQIGGHQIIEEWLLPVERQVQCFGFHLAKLDIRQNSDFHNKALEQMLKKAGFANYHYSEWTEEEKVRFLSEELTNNRPFVVAGQVLEHEATQVLECYRVVKQHVDKYGLDGIGSFIVSMTRGLSDLLVVYLFLREVGLMDQPIQVVPLFETIDDLKISDAVIDAFLSHPIAEKIYSRPSKVQEIMLGYSDSNKDGGIVSSRWNIYQTEIKLTEVAKKHGINFRFFHGIGGTISRGGGKYHRFLESMPRRTMSGEIKLTVQGESIAQQFANLLNATFNLEMLLAGTGRQTGYQQFNCDQPNYPILAIDTLDTITLSKYQELIQHPDFIRFYSEVTPIDVLEQSKIGSRPSRRTGKRSLSDLRAIPWVFSWKQCRFNITGWYGIGTGLKTLRSEYPDLYEQIKENVEVWPFLHYNLIQIETNLLNSDRDMMLEYAQLVTDETLRNNMTQLIMDEHQESLDQIADLLGHNIEVRRMTMLNNVRMRSKPLHNLHRLQISKLKEWREIKDTDPETADNLLVQLLMITSAISGGIKSTG